jgi:hypothetical protein
LGYGPVGPFLIDYDGWVLDGDWLSLKKAGIPLDSSSVFFTKKLKEITIIYPKLKTFPIGFYSEQFSIQILSPTIHTVHVTPQTDDPNVEFDPETISFDADEHHHNLKNHVDMMNIEKDIFIEKKFRVVVKRGTRIGEHNITFTKREYSEEPIYANPNSANVVIYELPCSPSLGSAGVKAAVHPGCCKSQCGAGACAAEKIPDVGDSHSAQYPSMGFMGVSLTIPKSAVSHPVKLQMSVMPAHDIEISFTGLPVFFFALKILGKEPGDPTVLQLEISQSLGRLANRN